MDIAETKKELRRQMRQTLKETCEDDRSAASAVMATCLLTSPLWQCAQQVMLFSSTPTEPSTQALLHEAWQAGKKVALPRVVGPDLEARLVETEDDLAPGYLDLLEPDDSKTKPAEPDKLQLVLVPGLAFDENGFRLGRGKGFYDRFLARLPERAIRLGCFFACQQTDTIPREKHDQRLDGILTEKELLLWNPLVS
jgi:5-formyltetrahydrofolate cyclo-ligase